ncbi:substrate-binding domain-containing protein [Marichromatium gracile]|uniref:Tungstate transport system substrate-binding protein n=1 Tax=Marichromatium gracile TaxID=1048 RepID=A0ABR5VHY2_MARGR|nr:substrate-binding domain-containing protein [Marichromatium gracile]KXX64007.1 hypothetical protein AY586_15100 [Marichromatium gracile]
MHRMPRSTLLLLVLITTQAHAAPAPTVPVAVVGGLVMCGVWPALAEEAERATGLAIDTVAAAPKDQVVPRFASGEADLLLIHGGEATFDLVARGLAAPLTTWAHNRYVILGPAADPAGVGEASDGIEALRRIAHADAPMIGYRDPGSYLVAARLWRAGGLRPGVRQQLPSGAETRHAALIDAGARGAYVIAGEIPVAFGRLPHPGLAVLLDDDPQMRRHFVVVLPGPAHPADAARRARAHRLADYLLGAAGQAALRAANRDGPWIHPNPTARH